MAKEIVMNFVTNYLGQKLSEMEIYHHDPESDSVMAFVNKNDENRVNSLTCLKKEDEYKIYLNLNEYQGLIINQQIKFSKVK